MSSPLDRLRSLARHLDGELPRAPSDFVVVPRPRRVAAALAIGAAAGAFCGLALARPGPGPDFQVFWEHARTLAAGGNPYAHPAVVGVGRVAPLLYPLPAAMLVVPFTRLPMPIAGALFFGLSSALLAYGATRDGWHRLLAFLSGPFIVAATLGQWSPLITAGALLPWLAGIAAVKPNLGLALFAYRPSWRMIAGGLLLLALSLALVPSWPLDWLRAVRAGNAIYHAPVASVAGALLLLALARWRNPEARLLLVMACVPHMMFFYDQLPLWLVARNWRESLFLSLASLCAWLGWVSTLRPGVTTNDFIPAAQPWVLFGIFFPALLVVLRQRSRTTSPSAEGAVAAPDGARRPGAESPAA